MGEEKPSDPNLDEGALRRELDRLLATKNKLAQDYDYYRRHLQDLSVEKDRIAKRIVEIQQRLNSFDVFTASRGSTPPLQDRRHQQDEDSWKSR